MIFTLTGKWFDYGEVLSPAVRAALPDLLTQIRTLVEEKAASCMN